jgi:hypothetical protein
MSDECIEAYRNVVVTTLEEVTGESRRLATGDGTVGLRLMAWQDACEASLHLLELASSHKVISLRRHRASTQRLQSLHSFVGCGVAIVKALEKRPSFP